MTANLSVDLATLERLLAEEIESETGATGITTGATLTELDIDSLSFSEVLMNTERRIGSETNLIETFELQRDTTVGDLLNALAAELGIGK